ncbi:cytochrome P450 [Ornithinimicrobium murale]|uniref:cytochrome P450 n=1 Tax=Ornithinimicrobium murale TaxID=1050153 RepID=UPI0013B36512|nr:cytochrome P450 [Ornithinimicrobium murale]
METVTLPLAELIIRWSRRKGPAFTVGVRPVRNSYLIGPGANAFIFGNDRLFRVREAFKALIPVDGETALIVTDGPDHTRRRALVRPGLHQRQINNYVQIMAQTADEALDSVPAGEPWDAYELFRAAIRRSTMRSLFGNQIASQADTMGRDLQPLLDLVNLWPQLVAAHERLGTPRWRRSVQARDRIDEVVYAEIARAREVGPDEASNVLSTLAHGRDAQGSGLSDLEVRDQVVSLIAAGYETTSGALGWLVHCVGADAQLQGQLREELAGVTAGAAPTAEQLRELPLLSAAVTETLRLYPPAALSARYVAEGFEFAGHRIPAGATLIYSPYVTHRDPDVYADPLEFRPQRWLEQPKRPPHEFLPFGGGAHRCIGSAMATTELTVMFARLLARGPFTIEPQRVRATSFAAMRPRDGMLIRQA